MNDNDKPMDDFFRTGAVVVEIEKVRGPSYAEQVEIAKALCRADYRIPTMVDLEQEIEEVKTASVAVFPDYKARTPIPDDGYKGKVYVVVFQGGPDVHRVFVDDKERGVVRECQSNALRGMKDAVETLKDDVIRYEKTYEDAYRLLEAEETKTRAMQVDIDRYGNTLRNIACAMEDDIPYQTRINDIRQLIQEHADSEADAHEQEAKDELEG